jgi:hypothetical protein
MNAPKCNEYDYIDFLIATPRVYSCTEAARVQPDQDDAPSHDAINRLLLRIETNSEDLWQEAAIKFRSLAAYWSWTIRLLISSRPERLNSLAVTGRANTAKSYAALTSSLFCGPMAIATYRVTIVSMTSLQMARRRTIISDRCC